MKPSGTVDLSFGTAAGRWARLGPYYAMFPLAFAEAVVTLHTQPADTVIDPFCGRGTTPFVAMVYARQAVGCDVNPVAWLYAKTKTDPHSDPAAVQRRIGEIGAAVTPDDRSPANRFQELAFCPAVLGFVHAARRELAWRSNRLDRTVATLLVQHLHDKLGRGLSNQLRHSRALAPRYSIRWWLAHGYHRPPQIDPVDFLRRRTTWRYAQGIPRPPAGEPPAIGLGPAATTLPPTRGPAALVLTSPPYSGVTNYRVDNWLRLWALGAGPPLPDWDLAQKFVDPAAYARMLRESMTNTRARTDAQTVWYVRSDARARTRDVIEAVMAEMLPDHRGYYRPAPYRAQTQTALYGDSAPKPGEVDLLYVPPRYRRRGFTLDFDPLARS